MILRQEMESYPIIIRACAAHTTKTTANKMKTPDDAVANGGHGSSKGTKLGYF